MARGTLAGLPSVVREAIDPGAGGRTFLGRIRAWNGRSESAGDSHFEPPTRRIGHWRPRVPKSPHGRVAAAEMGREFFLRFGWKPSIDQLLDHQCELAERNQLPASSETGSASIRKRF